MVDIAPVCHIAPEQSIQQPPPLNLPSIPPAGPSIESLVRTVNTMRQTIMILSGQQGSQGRPGEPGKNGQNNNAKGQWTENKQARVTEKVKIYNPSDTSQFVEVDRVNALQFVNKDTGQTWVWNR